MDDPAIDILMITHRRPDYTRLALRRLLDTCTPSMRVWVWHNGDHQPTLDVANGFRDHPCLHRVHHSEDNQPLYVPTNWFWENSEAPLVSKVDDDCLMPTNWGPTLAAAHRDYEGFGVLGCWRFPEEDHRPALAQRKTRDFAGHRAMLNCWVEGSGYVMKRRCIKDYGTLRPGQSFPWYCIGLARRGFVNGWAVPFLYQEHMDDPRSSHCKLRSDEDVRQAAPRMAVKYGITTLDGWKRFFADEAEYLQRAAPDPARFLGWRGRLARVQARLRRQPSRL